MQKITLTAILAALTATGCAGLVGTQTIERDATGSIVSVETRGIAWAHGDASVGGESTVEGGHVSEPFSAIFDNTIGAVARLVGGVLSPIGTISSALSADEPR